MWTDSLWSILQLYLPQGLIALVVGHNYKGTLGEHTHHALEDLTVSYENLEPAGEEKAKAFSSTHPN